MAVPKQDVTAWKTVMTILHTIAVSGTGVRLYDRFREQRLWWDDYLSVVPTILDILYFVALWMGPFAGHIYFMFSPNPLKGFLFPMCLHIAILWTTRIVLALSLSRLFPPNSHSRRVAFGLVVAFSLAYIFITLFTIQSCKPPGLPWYRASGINCEKVSARGLPIFVVGGITCDLMADSLLVIVPFTVIWRMKLRTPQRKLILAVASASILTIGSALAFSILCLSGVATDPDSLLLRLMMINMLSVNSLIACNFLVVSLFFYRRVRHWRTAREERTRKPPSTSSTATSSAKEEDVPPPLTIRLHATFETSASRRPGASPEHYSVVTLTDVTESPYASSYHPGSRSSRPSIPFSSMASGATGDVDLESRFTDRDPPPSWTFSSGHS
ncbi:unnamed protein product [Cyclocybe aegerita]|uniref:Rhodopsin domain-containing protein n=1 Tax=Cyclocybe aegerita TaxID=1973307 RepID=A0A8S0VYY0_CYCAE|nr:unnamed protein product [Cyclocybe aegerita]